MGRLSKSLQARASDAAEEAEDAFETVKARANGAAKTVRRQAHAVSEAIGENPGTAAAVLSSAGGHGASGGLCRRLHSGQRLAALSAPPTGSDRGPATRGAFFRSRTARAGAPACRGWSAEHRAWSGRRSGRDGRNTVFAINAGPGIQSPVLCAGVVRERSGAAAPSGAAARSGRPARPTGGAEPLAESSKSLAGSAVQQAKCLPLPQCGKNILPPDQGTG